MQPGRAGIRSSRLSLHGPGCERRGGEGAYSLEVGSGQVKQAEVRGRGPLPLRECLEDVTLGGPGGEGRLCVSRLTSEPGPDGESVREASQMQPLAGFPRRCAWLFSSRLGRSLLLLPEGTPEQMTFWSWLWQRRGSPPASRQERAGRRGGGAPEDVTWYSLPYGSGFRAKAGGGRGGL